MARNRVIYQSQALFIAPSSTGVQVSGVSANGLATTGTPFTPVSTGSLASGISLLKKMDRIQNCNFNFSINRQDINEFGKLARIDSIVMETPTVGLDFSYYATDGYNERLMGFNITGFKSDGTTFIDTNIVVPSTLSNLSIFIGLFTITMLLVFNPLTLVPLICFSVCRFTSPISLIFKPITFIDILIAKISVFTFTMSHIFFIISNINSTKLNFRFLGIN